jgi:hypothetical protein
MDRRPEALIKRYQALKEKRGSWNTHYDDLARVMLPRRLGFASSVTVGDKRTEEIFDGTPMQAARGLANAIGGMLRPDGQDWFEIKAEGTESDEEAQMWLDEASRRLRASIDNPRARFRQATGETDLDLVVFGTGCVYVGEARSLDRLIFQSVHLKDALVFFGEEGEPEGMFRTRKYTIRQAAEKFGEDNLSKASREKFTNKRLDDEVEVLHAIVPRAEGRVNALLSSDMLYADVAIEINEKHEITAGGMAEFPFAVPRWDTSSGEDMGRSPGMIALPDANTLQAMGETMLVAGQRAADPPLMAPNDGSFGEVNAFPGGLSYYDVETAASVRGNPFFPLETGSNMPLTREMQQDMREQVFAAFFRNVLNLPTQGPEMTAYEVMQRKEEFIREIGPVFGRLESDYTAPMVERAFNIMLRAGAFPPIPDALAGRSVRFEYVSPVKRIREQAEAVAASEWANAQFQRAQFDPGALDLVNIDALARFEADAYSLPAGIVNSPERVGEIRQQRAEAAKASEEMAMLQQGAQLADSMAGTADKAGLLPANDQAA